MSGPYRLVRESLTPLIVLNCAVMVVSGGLILSGGLWQVLWPGALVLFISPMVFPLLMMPAAMCGRLSGLLASARPRLANVLLAASVGWLVFVMALAAAWSFESISGLMTGPALLWGAAGAVTPWAVFARLDRDNVFFTGLVLMLQAGCIAAAAAGFSHGTDFWSSFRIVGSIMAALACGQALYESRFMKRA